MQVWDRMRSRAMEVWTGRWRCGQGDGGVGRVRDRMREVGESKEGGEFE